MNSYIFVVAAVVSVFSVYYVLNRLINEVKTDQVPFKETQKKFLIGIFLSKIIPLIFLFYGIFKMTPKDLSDLYIPWIIIGIAAIIGLVLIEKVKKDNKNEATEVYINYLITFTRPLMLTLPLMSAVFLYLMTIK
ncbi:MAG TPA: hypothetical protein VK121_10355 [Pseudogracilibacillus sp.]|nr:hypothetical protein [Pseudogracilibacillus sp.]